MIKTEASGNGNYCYGVIIDGFIDYSEYEQILMNLKKIEMEIKAFGENADMRRRKPMAEYTYADVIIDPEDPRVEIGKEYYFGDCPLNLIIDAENDYQDALGCLEYKDSSNRPFYCAGFKFPSYPCIIRKKEPKKRYVPFDLSDAVVREQLWGKRIVIKDEYIIGNELRFPREIHSIIIGFTYCPEGEPRDDWTIDAGDYSLTAEEALKKAFFYDETPCGKLVEV